MLDDLFVRTHTPHSMDKLVQLDPIETVRWSFLIIQLGVELNFRPLNVPFSICYHGQTQLYSALKKGKHAH